MMIVAPIDNTPRDYLPLKPYEKNISNLPSDIFYSICKLLSRYDIPNLVIANKATYFLGGNTHFWMIFAQKVGVSPKFGDGEEFTLNKRRLNKYTLKPLDVTNNLRGNPTNLKESGETTTITPFQSSHKSRVEEYLDPNSPLNTFKFALHILRYDDNAGREYLTELYRITQQFLRLEPPLAVEEKKVIASKAVELFFSCERPDENSDDNFSTHLINYNLTRFRRIFDEFIKHTDQEAFLGSYFIFMRDPKAALSSGIDYVEVFSIIKESLENNKCLRFVAMAELCLGKVYYYRNRGEEDITLAYLHFQKVIENKNAPARIARDAKFYQLMLAFHPNGQLLNISDEVLAKGLLALLNERKLCQTHRQWVQMRLVTLLQEERTDLINNSQALNLLQGITHELTNSAPTLLKALVSCYGPLFEIRCKVKSPYLNMLRSKFAYTHAKMEMLTQFCHAVETLQGESAHYTYIEAKEILEKLIKDNQLGSEEKIIAEKLCKTIADLYLKSDDEEYMFGVITTKGGEFIKHVSDRLIQEEKFLLSLVNHNHDYIKHIDKRFPINDEFLQEVADNDILHILNTYASKKVDYKFLITCIDRVTQLIRRSKRSLRTKEMFKKTIECIFELIKGAHSMLVKGEVLFEDYFNEAYAYARKKLGLN